jgi:hypothetical protein
MFLAPVWESESEGTGSADKKRSAGSGACPCDSGGCDSLNHDGMAMLVTPPLL